jgi:hypothetical protein
VRRKELESLDTEVWPALFRRAREVNSVISSSTRFEETERLFHGRDRHGRMVISAQCPANRF